MKLNKIFSKFFVLALASSVLFACTAKQDKKENLNLETSTADTQVESSESTTELAQEKIKVISEIFPAYDWLRVVAGENIDKFDLSLLLDKGNDLHSYKASAKDIADIANADLFIYVGGISDFWVDDVVKSADNKELKTINLVEVIGDRAKLEEVVEGMQEEDEHEHEHDEADHDEAEHADEEHHEEEEEIDEHVWLSLKNAKIYVNEIARVLSEIDPESSEIYKDNASAYISELDDLDKEYETVIKNANKDTILFGDRFPFRYLVDDYNLKYYAAFVGCSAETEASFDTVIYLAKKVDELNLDNILAIEGSNTKVASTIVDNTKDKNKNILILNSIQSTKKEDIEKGLSYYKIMNDNLEVLKEVLK